MTDSAAGAGQAPHQHAQAATPDSREPPAPAHACDCHIHIYDDRFPAVGEPTPMNFPVSAYRLVQQRIGTTRTVVVTPTNYVTDPRCMLDAISQLGPAVTRGIAVVHPNVTDAELQRLTDAGIRGIRFTVGNPAAAVTTIDMIEPLARRVNEFGWHVQLHMRAHQIVEHAELLQRLASPIVFDHMGRLPLPMGIRHGAFAVIRRLLDRGRAWVKVSGPFHESKLGPPAYADVTEVAQAYIKAAPERMVWGSDLPHASKKNLPDDALIFGLLAQWAPDQRTWHRILVENPETLYGFPKSA